MWKWFGHRHEAKKEKRKPLLEGEDEAAPISAPANPGAEEARRLAETVSEEKGGQTLSRVEKELQEQHFGEGKRDREETKPHLSQVVNETLYAGEIELAIDAPANLKLLSKLYSSLQTVPELRIVRTAGSPNRGLSITITLERPVPLIKVISAKIPGMETVEEPVAKDSMVAGEPVLPPLQEKKGVTKIRLALGGE